MTIKDMRDNIRIIAQDSDGSLWAFEGLDARLRTLQYTVVDTMTLTGEVRRVPHSTEKITIGLRSGQRYHVFADGSIGSCRDVANRTTTVADLCPTCARFSEVTK